MKDKYKRLQKVVYSLIDERESFNSWDLKRALVKEFGVNGAFLFKEAVKFLNYLMSVGKVVYKDKKYQKV